MDKSKFQIFIENLLLSSLSLLKILLLSKFRIKYEKSRDDDSECIILGNGPSLNKTIAENPFFFKNKTLICVNHFAESDLYKELKPNYYVLNAPEMWMDNVDVFNYKKGENLFKAIAKNTFWDIVLYINYNAKKYKRWYKTLSSNSYIHINYFNTTPIEGYNFFNHFLFKRNLGMPRTHNVLIPSLMIILNSKFEKIYISGADHSWLKEINVTDDNRVLLTQKHFYDKKTAKELPMGKLGKGERKLHEILMKFAYSFKGYFRIKKYADLMGISIINITQGSFIDAFEKLNITNNE